MRNFIVLLLLLTLIVYPPLSNTGSNNINSIRGSINLAEGEKILIVASNEILAGIARYIAGVYGNVTWILPPGATPHDYSPTYEDIQLIKSADLVIFANSSFFALENNLKKNVEKSVVVDASDYIEEGAELIQIPNFGVNIHGFWLLPSNALAIARAVEKKLEGIASTYTDYFRENLEEFEKKIEKLKADLRDVAIDANLFGKGVVVAVPGAAYVAYAFGADVKATLMGGPQTTVNASLMNELIQKAKNGEIKGVFCPITLRGTSADDAAKQFASDAGIPIYYVRIFSVGGLADYFMLMEFNAGVLSQKQRAECQLDTLYVLYIGIAIVTVIALLEGIIIFRMRKNIEENL